jgi:hypothetical protein
MRWLDVVLLLDSTERSPWWFGTVYVLPWWNSNRGNVGELLRIPACTHVGSVRLCSVCKQHADCFFDTACGCRLEKIIDILMVVVGIGGCHLIGEGDAISGGQRGALSFRFSFVGVVQKCLVDRWGPVIIRRAVVTSAGSCELSTCVSGHVGVNNRQEETRSMGGEY